MKSKTNKKEKLFSDGKKKYVKFEYDFNEIEELSYEVKTICQLFEENVIKNPSHTAIDYKNKIYTYEILNKKANQLARHIRKEYKLHAKEELKPDTLIPICIGRSAEYIIGILAILKAGGAYVPINPDYPNSRIKYMLEDINSKLIITESTLACKFEIYNHLLKQIPIDILDSSTEDIHNLNIRINSSNLAYVIYTSGSTGTPKGVIAKHINVLSQVICADYFCANEFDHMAFFSDVAFDSTTFEIWGALLNGASLFIPEKLLDLLSNPLLFKETITKKKITILLLTRALFDVLYTLDETVFESLKFLLVGGEALTKNLMLKLCKSNYKPQFLINAYGPTENSTFCTTYEIKDDSFNILNSVPIGKPYSNRVGFVLDKHKQLLPVGIVGELYVGGPSLSKGYLNLKKLTDERFIPNPFINLNSIKYPKIYKTNDLVKWLPEGNLEYVGRNDFQIKLRGYRIELGEIEAKLLELSKIKHCIVILHKKEVASYLIAYYVSDDKLEDQIIRDHLASSLPEYMVPSFFIHLEILPVTTSGKLDRKALPEPIFQPEKIEYINNELQGIEKTLYVIWSKILNISNFSLDESFFHLGGSSLTAMKVRQELEDTFKIKINIVDLFQYTTIKQLANRVSELTLISENNEIFLEVENKHLIQHTIEPSIENEVIAIIGMACRIPEATNPESFWDLLLQEKSNIRDYSAEELKANQVNETLINDPAYVKRGAVLENSFSFDAEFFGYSVKDAEVMDPQQRQFLECAWEALEYSGNIPEKFAGDIGVFASQGRNYYFLKNVYSDKSSMSETKLFQAILGNEKDFLATRVSFKLNLTGPSITLQTACSSSLVSVHMACESLKARTCDMALAGGVSLFYNYGYLYQDEMIEAPDGYCRAFDAKAKGTVITSGVGVVVLKRLSDAIKDKDTIYAVIKGGAINNDGSAKMGFTAPSVKGQVAVIERAIKNAKIEPQTIRYIEAHGTGTSLGDPIEWAALHEVFQKHIKQKEFCTIGALKTNIGHTDAAAGVLGLIKVVLALKHKIIPATLNFDELNPEIASFNYLFQVSSNTCYWDSQLIPRRAAVSSFGLGGTNAHIILEEYNGKEESVNLSPFALIPFSAKNEESLSLLAKEIQKNLETSDNFNLHDFAFTAQQGRAEFKKRGYFVVKTDLKSTSIKERIAVSYICKNRYENKPEIIFILSQIKLNSAKQVIGLYKNYPIFRNSFLNCSTILYQNYNINLKNIFSENEQKFNEIYLEYSKLVNFCIQYSLSRLLIACGLEPDGFIAYGLGMYLAAALSGISSLEETLSAIISEEKKQKFITLITKKINNINIKIFSFETLDWATNEEVKNPQFWHKNIERSVFSLLDIESSKTTNHRIFVEIGSELLFDRINENEKSFINFSLNKNELLEYTFLNLMGWVWAQGLSLIWENINISAPYSKKIRIPTYCFIKNKYKITSSQKESIEVQQEKTKTSAETSLDMQLKEMWANVLGISIDEITPKSHFFDLGGDSLSFIDLFNMVKKSYLSNLKLEEIINHNEYLAMLNFLKSKIY